MKLPGRHAQTLRRIFEEPTPASIRWDDIVSLCKAAGATIKPRGGSKVAIKLNGRTLFCHRPHPEAEASQPLVRQVRNFLESVGVTP